MDSRIRELDFATLAAMDGGVHNAEFRKRLSVASKDCQERPGDVKAREIDVKIKFTPVVDQDGYVTDVKMHVDVASKIPPYRSKEYSLGARRRGDQGTFVFDEDSLGDANQGTIGFDDDDDES